MGNRKKGMEDLEKLLKDYAVNCRALVQGENNIVQSHAHYTSNIERIKDIKAIADENLQKSRNPVYAQIIELCDKILLPIKEISKPEDHK